MSMSNLGGGASMQSVGLGGSMQSIPEASVSSALDGGASLNNVSQAQLNGGSSLEGDKVDVGESSTEAELEQKDKDAQ